MSAGRTPNTATVIDVIDPTLDQTKIDNAMVQMRADSVTEQATRDQRLARFSEQVGIAKYVRLQDEMSAAARIRIFLEIKESNDFKHLPIVRADGNVRPADTLDELCPLVFGRSYNVMAEEAQNFNALGEGTFEAVQSMGLNRRQFRLIRSLPDAQRTAVAEAIAAQSKSEVVAIIEDLAAKLAVSHEAIAEAKKEKTAVEKVLEFKNKQIDQLQLVQALPPNEQLPELQKTATGMMHETLGQIRGKLRQAFLALNDHPSATDNSVFMAGLLGQIQREVNALRTEYNLPDVSSAEEQAVMAAAAQWAIKKS